MIKQETIIKRKQNIFLSKKSQKALFSYNLVQF